MKVLKFGGTSLASADRVRQVARVVDEAAKGEPVVVVVSAFGGVTNALVGVADSAVKGDPQWPTALAALERRHLETALALAPPSEAEAMQGFVREAFGELSGLVRGASLVRECTARTLDSVMSHGERLSAALVAAGFRGSGLDAEAVDARSLVVTDKRFGSARVEFSQTYARIRSALLGRQDVPVVTGFLGATAAGETTTLGRGGSDYTAALVGAALEASAIEIWTDVDGVMSADPRLVSDAFSIPSLSYDELMELSHFGAKVVYPPTVHPARERSITLVIRNTLNPGFSGTMVSPAPSPNPYQVRGIASVPQVALLRLEGDGMVGVPGIAMRLFGALAEEGISVVLITQASSEHSICFAIEPQAVARARERLRSEFSLERAAGLIDELVVEDDVALVAVVGEAMRERAGIAGRIFGILGERGVNVRAIAQGSSELNITVAVSRPDEARAVQAIHDAFFSRPRHSVAVALAGAGRVGSALLDQIAAQHAALLSGGIGLDLVGLCRSGGGLIEPRRGVPWGSWRDAKPGGTSLADLVRVLQGLSGRRVFVDCTASDAPPAFYEALLSSGVHVVAANKLAFAGDLAAYRRLKEAARGAQLRYETTVAAGLPVLSTLADLVATGDAVRRIEGCLSGTIVFLLGRLQSGVAFSQAVREAHALGYTEPDCREDLGGADVGRKLLILAREAGFAAEGGDLRSESLLPGAEWASLSLGEFWEALPRLDEHYRELCRTAQESSRRLAYVAVARPDGLEATLQMVAADHPCHGLSGTENVVAFWTDRYSETPLVVRGPGAGPAVTAAGVFADILRAARSAS